MKKVMGYRLWVIGLVIFLSFLIMACAMQPDYQASKSAPGQEADPYSWDFGRVKEGEALKHTFILKNESHKTMAINDVNTSCGCTASKVEKKILLPGQSATLEVQFNSKGYSGPVQQYVYVHTDSLDKPIIKFIIKADVIKTK